MHDNLHDWTTIHGMRNILENNQTNVKIYLQRDYLAAKIWCQCNMKLLKHCQNYVKTETREPQVFPENVLGLQPRATWKKMAVTILQKHIGTLQVNEYSTTCSCNISVKEL